MKKRRSFFRQLGLFIILILSAVAIWFFIFQLPNSQDIRQQASTSDTVDFSLQGGSTAITSGQNFVVDININTKTKLVSGVTVQGKIEGISKDRVALSFPPNILLKPAYQSITETNGVVYFEFIELSAPASKSVFSSNNSAQKIAALVLTPANSGTIKVELLPSPNSQVVEYSKGITLLQIPGQQSYNITVGSVEDTKKSCNSNCATDTECKSGLICYKGQCRSSADREDSQCGIKPDQGIHRSCNEYCADSRECDSKYVCYYNRCRLAVNVDNTSCTLPPLPTPVTSTVGKGGYYARSSPSPSPRTVQATIIIDKNKPSTTSGIKASPKPSPSPSPSPRPKSSPQPSLKPTPTPAVVQPAKKSGGFSNILLAALGVGAVIGLIGFGIYYWQNK